MWAQRCHCGSIILTRIVCSVCLLHRHSCFLVTTGHLFRTLSFLSQVILKRLSRWLLKVFVWEVCHQQDLGEQSLLLLPPMEARLSCALAPQKSQFEQQIVPFSTLIGSRHSSRKVMLCFPRVVEDWQLSFQLSWEVNSEFWKS